MSKVKRWHNVYLRDDGTEFVSFFGHATPDDAAQFAEKATREWVRCEERVIEVHDDE